MIKLLVGILKGAVIGGALGYGAHALAKSTGFDNPWLTFGLIGAIVGLFVGKPIWTLVRDKNATTWIAVIKSAFGVGIGIGLYALVTRAIQPVWEIEGYNVFTWYPTLGGAIGAVYGGFVELDDAIGDDKTAAPSKKDGSKQLPKKN
ncbi:MAG: hypothetical protein JWP01_1714 [Myxococcales bacterium]|nr:hypothetical protein [Myxococcales bacterium]